jgi:glycosyltransferase involved in cell wall biosynthesis
MASDAPTVSVVVPVFDEEASIEALHRRVASVLEGAGEAFELVLVDDGSRDGSWDAMRALAARDPRVVLVHLSRNFGHQVAVSAGIDAARGDAVVLMDADLQDPPEVVPDMIARWREGYDVVYGRRTRRPGETWFKRATAAGFYRVIRRLTAVDIPADTGDFRLMSSRVVRVLRQLPERNRFIRGMVAWIGYRQTAVEYERAERLAGETKYPLRKMARFAADAIVSFSFAPLRLATGLGLVVSTLSFAYGVYAVLAALFQWHVVRGWASLMAAVAFLGGVQLVCVGIIGEYIGRIYDEVKRRPLYVADVHRAGEVVACAPPGPAASVDLSGSP